MNISGIRPSVGFYDYNSIKIRPEDVAAVDSSSSESAISDAKISITSIDDEIASARAKQTFTDYDYANTYKPGETYDMKGADSDLKSLDVANAISGMQKDSAIQQYQFFVGDSISAVDTEPSIRGAEDFVL